MSLPGLEELAVEVAAAASSNDPTAYLLAEHAWVRDVLDDMRERVKDSGSLSSDDIEQFGAMIDLHIRREEEAYFPLLEPIVQAMRIGTTEEMYGEHDAIRICMEGMQDSVARVSDLNSPLAALRRSLLVHFENEEELLFYEPAGRLTDDARREILAGFAALEARQA